MDEEVYKYVILYFTLIILPLVLIVTNILFLTVGEARKVKENMETKPRPHEAKRPTENVFVLEKPMKTEENGIIDLIKKYSSCPALDAPDFVPVRRYSRRLSKTESEETADILLEMMFRPDDFKHSSRNLKQSVSDNCGTRRRKFGFSKGSFGLSINTLNMIKEADM